ncbi:MAG: hypothetical protein V3R31_03535, partial [Candidatus Humimicrobiaceae bacterium]
MMLDIKKKHKYILVNIKTWSIVVLLLLALVLSGTAGCGLFGSETAGPEEGQVVEDETEIPEEE